MTYPNIVNSEYISFDIETHDPLLIEKGQGSFRKDGYIVGVSISNGNYSEYYDIGHSGIKPELKRKNTEYLKDILESPVSKKVGANIKYDIEWLREYLSIDVKGQLIDIQIAEPLIDENQFSYSLDNLSKKYLGIEKYKDDLSLWCSMRGLQGDSRRHMAQMPYDIVRQYAIVDAENSLKIWKLQEKILEDQDLTSLFQLEMKLFPLLLKMRKHGVRVDILQLENLIDRFSEIHKNYVKELYSIAGGGTVNYNSAMELKPLFDKFGIAYELTGKSGIPSITAGFLEARSNIRLCEVIHKCRNYEKALNTFLNNNIKEMLVGDRIHCNFNSLRSDEYGTVSGRFSSSNPNMQQIPNAGDSEIGNPIRSLFIPEDGMKWLKFDYSQIEVRIIGHYATGRGADDIRKAYQTNPKTDFYQWCADLTGITRKRAKAVILGKFYGMGVNKLSIQMGISYEEAKELNDEIIEKLPFIKTTLNMAGDMIVKRSTLSTKGFVKTFLGRRRRLAREYKYKALNSVIQGTAADLMKKAMVDSYEAGIFDVLLPHLTVHDEIDCSIPDTKEGMESAKELKYILENAIKFNVPVIAEGEVGENWGNLKDLIF